MKRTAIPVFLFALALPALAADPATNAPPRRRGFARQEAEAAAFLASDPSPLARFLDTQFGPYDNSPSRFLKLREPFGPFRWIRCVQDREGRQCLVDGELVFLAEEDADPAPLVSSLESLRGAFERDWAVSFESPAACARPDDVLFLSGTNGAYRVAVELRDDGPVDDPAGGGAGLRRLVARFEVWNAVLAPYRDFGCPPRRPRLWSEVFAPIVVRAAGAADPSAWIYRPPEGPSTEEILREAIRLRDGKHAEAVAGAPVGTRFGGGGREVGAEDARAFFRAAPDGGAHGYFCTEAEADGVLDAFGEPRFVRFADRDETARIYRLFLTPAALRPRKPGERRWHGEECPDGEILPGDRLVWHTGEFRDRNEGVVCAEGEDGVPVAAFGGVRVKDVRTTEAPRPEDRDWTAFHDWREKSETMRRRAWEINRAAKETPDDPATLGRAVAFLRELDALDEPGLYTAPHGESSLADGDRAQVRAYVARRTREAREWFQFALRNCRAIVASGFARLELADGRLRRFLPDETAAALGLTRLERLAAESDRTTFAPRIQPVRWELELLPRRLPAAGPVPALPPDAAARLDALALAATNPPPPSVEDAEIFAEFRNRPSPDLGAFLVEAVWQAEVLLAGGTPAERAGRLPRIARLVRERAPSETAPDFAAYVLAAWPDDPDARLFADALLGTQLPAAEEPHAESAESEPHAESAESESHAENAETAEP